jgi:erythritol transport system ATP-binding protein
VSKSRSNADVVVKAESVSKIFGGTVALNGVDFNVYSGKVNALVGENGAGKSTLMGILAGVYKPTAGRILLDGEQLELASPRDAGDHGIRLIHQELLLFPNLSVAENIFAGSELQSATGVRLREQERQAAGLLQRLGQRVNPRSLIRDLAVGAQQIVAICKALSQQVRVLIMDEPTSALSTREIESLFAVVRGLVAEGVSVVYISHRLEEIMEIGDFVTVLRDGRLVAEAAVSKIDSHWIVEQMIGRDPEELFPYEPRPVGAPLLEAYDLTLPRPGGGLWLDRVSLSLGAGEIVGVYGLMGAGRTELLQTLIGERREAVGRVVVDGVRVDGESIGARIARGLFLVPEDRQREGLVSVLSVKQNVSLASLDDLGSFGNLSLRREAREVGTVVRDVGVKVPDIDFPVTSLSGGNQQKVVVAKALLTDPKVLLMDDPMRGIDVGAKTELYRIMKRLAKEGIAILFTSSDLKEVLGMADRILVMARGRITRELSRDEATSQALVAASNPHAVETAA